MQFIRYSKVSNSINPGMENVSKYQRPWAHSQKILIQILIWWLTVLALHTGVMGDYATALWNCFMIREGWNEYYIVGKFGGGKVWWIYLLWAFGKKVWRMNIFSQKVITVSRNFVGFSLVNHGWFTKFAKLSACQTFPLYGILNANK